MSPALENSLIVLGSTAALTGLLTYLIEKKKSSWLRSLEGLRADLGKDMHLQIEQIKKEFSKEIQVHHIQFAKEFHILQFLWQHIAHLSIALNDASVAAQEKRKEALDEARKRLAEIQETILIRSPFLPEKINSQCRKLSASITHYEIEMMKEASGAHIERLAEERLRIKDMVLEIEESVRERVFPPR